MKSKRNKLITLLCLPLMLAACMKQVESPYADVLTSWQGATTAELYPVWGYPNRIIQRHGHQTLVYQYTQQETVSGQEGTLPKVTTVTCLTWFGIDSTKHIVTTGFSDDACTASPGFVKAYSRPARLPTSQQPVTQSHR